MTSPLVRCSLILMAAIKHKGSCIIIVIIIIIIIIIISGDQPVCVYPVRLSDSSSFTAEQRVETDEQIRAASTSSITVMSSPLLINISESERLWSLQMKSNRFWLHASHIWHTSGLYLCEEKESTSHVSVSTHDILIWSEVSHHRCDVVVSAERLSWAALMWRTKWIQLQIIRGGREQNNTSE